MYSTVVLQSRQSDDDDDDDDDDDCVLLAGDIQPDNEAGQLCLVGKAYSTVEVTLYVLYVSRHPAARKETEIIGYFLKFKLKLTKSFLINLAQTKQK